MGIGEVIRPLKNSLDGVPVHVRQLADMFRKHSQRQDLNRSQVTALDNVSGAWRTDTHWTQLSAGWAHVLALRSS